MHSSSKSFLGVVLVKFPRLARGLISLAVNISVIMPIPMSHEGFASFCNCLFAINTPFKIGLGDSLILFQYLASFTKDRLTAGFTKYCPISTASSNTKKMFQKRYLYFLY